MVGITLVATLTMPVHAPAQGAPGVAGLNYAIPSWGDYVCVFGPGTDPAMDTPEAIENMIKHWKGRGFAGVFFRTDLVDLAPDMIRRNPVVQPNARLAALWKYIDDVSESMSVQAVAQKLADRHDFELWAWHPHLYSDGAPENIGTPGPGRMIPWSYCSTYTYEHPEALTVDRKGNPLWMVREYAYPEARASKVAEFVHMAKTNGVKRFIACMRSEVNQLVDPPDKADRYGFNGPVVADMKRLHGVDILTDPRFDVDSAEFDPTDPMVENWHNLRGTYVTQFYRELRQALDEVDPTIQIAVTLSGERVGPPLGNWTLDWRTWVDEGLVGAIITPTFFEATLDHEAHRKGYLTDVRAGKGTVSFATLREHIAASKHPDVKVIATGAGPYFPVQPPTGTDGWRTDIWYDSYHLAWYQRWEQWKRDLADFGHVKFIEQNFDDVQHDEDDPLEAWGVPAYSPMSRACGGCWYRLGQGDDARPSAQEEVRRGDRGRAIKLVRSSTSDCSFTAWHNSAPDRSTPTSCVDNAITNGRCTLEYWVYRESEASSLSAWLQADGTERDIGLRVTGPDGAVAYADHGKWVASGHSLPVGQWERLAINVDLDNGTYSTHAGPADETTLCTGIPYEVPETRYVEQHGVNLPIPIPAHKMIKVILFAPEGEDGSVTYLDDVSLRWTPTLHYAEPGPEVCFADDFESRAVGARVHGAKAIAGEWRTDPADSAGCTIHNGTSFGEGVKCLLSSGEADLVAVPAEKLTLAGTALLAADLDVFIRSSAAFPSMIPDPTTKSAHQVTLSLRGAGTGRPAASVRAAAGVWQYWDGSRYVDSAVRIAYDVWNHLQLAIDTSSGSCQVVAQPVGEMPTPVGTGKLGEGVLPGEDLELVLSPSRTEGHISCYDNVRVMRTPADK